MRTFRWIGVLLVGLALPTTLAAQATITGKVTSGSGAPLQSASVFIQGLNVGTLTGQDGGYSFQVPAARFRSGQQVQIIAQLLGYRAEAHTVTLTTAATTVSNFTLQLDPLRLTEVVATGSGTEARRERLGNSVASVAGADVQKANEPNVLAALSGKVPNVLTTQSGGDAGSSTAIQIRGPKSFGTSQPTIIVDGVPINNNTRSMYGALQGAPTPNRAIDINPEDIESIEILKGAASTSIYGSAAGSAGAILITTKRGKAGRTSYTLRTTYQSDRPQRYLPVQMRYGLGSNGVSGNCTGTNCQIGAVGSWGPELAAGTPVFNHAEEMYENGSIFDTNLSASGGNERTTFYLSAGGLRHNGFIVSDKDRFDRYSVRFNGSHALFDRMTIAANGSYVQTSGIGSDRNNSVSSAVGLNALRQPPEFNAQEYQAENGLHRSFRFPNPGVSCAKNNTTNCNRGWDNPFYAVNNHFIGNDTGRFFGNINMNYKPIDWLQVNYSLGADYTSDDQTVAFATEASGTNAGSLDRWQITDRVIDSNLNATASFQLNQNILSSLTLGQNLSETKYRNVYVFGTVFIAPEPFKLSNVTNRASASDTESKRRLEGYFAQGTLDLFDQVFLQARIRNDGSSAFGVEDQRRWYPGGSAAWSFTKALSLPENIVSFGKARIAYGESGQQPALYLTQDVYTTGSFADFSPGSVAGLSPINGLGGIYPSTARGNPNISPERVQELEGGFDLALLRGRADFSATYYTSKSSEIIFSVQTPPSTGYSTISLNAGELENKGWELSANVRPVMRSDFSIEIGANWARNRNMVLSLGALDAQTDGLVPMPTAENCTALAKYPRCQTGFASAFSGQTTHAQVGYPLGVWRSVDFARCGRDLTTIGANDIAAACVGQPAGALYIGADGFPIQDPNTYAFGNPWPDWTGGLSATLNFKGIEVSAFLDHRQGGDMLNMTRGSMYSFGTHKDTEIRGESRTFGKDMLCHNQTCDVLNGPVVGPGAGTAVVLGQSWFQGLANQSGPITTRLEDGTHTRLREVTVGYSFRQPWVQKIANTRQMDVKVSGRNLKLWTDYSGLDPEANAGGAANANRGIDWFGTPFSRSIIVSVALHH
jgi:TonB-linked SusC/RagA family outer membrane protein